MPKTIKVLFLAAEADPFVKIGGLGDVAGSLPRAFRALPPDLTGDVTVDIRLVLPFHAVIRARTASLRPLPPFVLKRDGEEVPVEAFETTLEGMPVNFIAGGPIDSGGSVYSSNAEIDAEKYTFFSLAVLELIRQLDWHPDVVHANDWHTALSAYGLLVQQWQDGRVRPASVITVHNLPFLGPDIHKLLEAYDVPLAQTDLPDWARLKPLPLGLWSADSIVAVSPTYADEMLSEEYGAGLNDFLKTRRQHLTGILNGIDVTSFNPATDLEIAARFSVDSLAEREANKAALARLVGFSYDPAQPLFGVVSRMETQKGIDLILDGLRKLIDLPPAPPVRSVRTAPAGTPPPARTPPAGRGVQAIILGTGDPKLEESARKLAMDCPDQVHFEAKYDAKLARQIYAGADIFLMPSRYEPCGLSQMIAMRYGCVPVVRAVGGLHDTVTDRETGFVFIQPKVKDFIAALQRAMESFKNKETWSRLQINGMNQDFSWTNSALKYLELYKRLTSHPRVPLP